MKSALVLGAGGFIGHHLVKDLKKRGYFVRAVDLHLPEFEETLADEFIEADLRRFSVVVEIFDKVFDEVYQLAANMGGAGFIFVGENDAEIFQDNAIINLNVAKAFQVSKSKKLFFSSSACVYPKSAQDSLERLDCSEEKVYPAFPDSDYGWEKLFAERLYQSLQRNFSLDIKIARFHNIYGELCTWKGGREKAPAAICRKVVEAKDGSFIQIWGDGLQTRSFLYIDDCLDAIRRLMESSFSGPYNIGSEAMISIRELAQLVISHSGKRLAIEPSSGPQGVRHRNSNNKKVLEDLRWTPQVSLEHGLSRLYFWISHQAKKLNR